MKLEQLRAKQQVFVKDFDEAVVADIHRRLRTFQTTYPVSGLGKLPIDEYIYGKFRINQHPTFCYWMEKELSDFGRIAGSPCFQYGVWYGTHGEDKEVRYRKTKKYGDTVEEAYRKVIVFIQNLLEAGAKKDFNAIAANRIANKFKGKILATYYPEIYLSIYADDYLNDILKYFSLDDGSSYKEAPILQQQRLIRWKNADDIMKHWNLTQFAIFINRELNAYYDFEKKGVKKNEENKVPRFPELGEILPVFSTDEIDPSFKEVEKVYTAASSKVKPKKNYAQKTIRDTAVGTRGEQIVMEWERRRLKCYPELLARLEWVSEHTDSFGYDINSVELDGTSVQIEVKTTTRPSTDKIDFFLTEFERTTALSCKNYYIYYVSDILNTRPGIWAIRNPFKENESGVHLSPVVYKASLKKETP
ncbi:DUF3883 domain-containing protein [Terrimonas ferruginea]|uniref:DUF3883 domain-containing protein n=1 Tax=Terrimonas ferruginea TaxID=249 RepID=UPI00048EACE6|nr:DUF3883 domain-containing protein [Terrimonas ferruginea]